MIISGALLAVLLAGTAPVTDVRAPSSALATQPGIDGRVPTADDQQPAVDEPPPSAYDKAREHDGQSPETHSLVGQFIKTIVALAVVIALIWVIFRFGAARLLPGLFGTAPVGPGRIVRIVERVAIDQRSSLLVVDAASERMLLSVGATGVAFIARLDKSATPEPARPSGGPAGFRSVLEGLSPKKPSEPKNVSEDDDAPK